MLKLALFWASSMSKTFDDKRRVGLIERVDAV